MQFILKCFLLFLPLMSLSAVDNNYLKQIYKAEKEQRIVSINDVPYEQHIMLLLSDGTLWESKYLSMGDRLKVLQKWHVGQQVWISRHKGDAEGVYRIASASLFPESYVELTAKLDHASTHQLPVVMGRTDKGHLLLSDGSEWKEDYWFFSVTKHWDKGQNVLVIYENGSTYKLINCDHVHSFFFDTESCDANLEHLQW